MKSNVLILVETPVLPPTVLAIIYEKGKHRQHKAAQRVLRWLIAGGVLETMVPIFEHDSEGQDVEVNPDVNR